jgi:RecB family exonuclease
MVETRGSFRWEDFDPHRETVVVADLGLKNALQVALLEKHGALAEHSILRASELWQILLRRHFTDFRLVSNDYMEFFARQWLETHLPQRLSTGPTAKLLLEYVHQFLAVFAAEEHWHSLLEWLDAQPTAQMRLGWWVRLAEMFWREALREKILLARWAPGLLLTLRDPLQWKRRTFFHVGAELSALEAALIVGGALGEKPVVIVPALNDGKAPRDVVWAYEVFGPEVLAAAATGAMRSTPGPRRIRRLATELAEVQDAVGSLRSAAEAGCPLDEMVVVAADIENYWLALSEFLQREGLPVKKPVLLRWTSRPAVARWFSQLRLRARGASYEDMDLHLFGTDHPRHALISYERFQRLFRRLMGVEDLSRDAVILDLYRRSWCGDEKITLMEFLAQEMNSSEFRDEALPFLLDGLGRLIEETPSSTRWSQKLWAQFLEARMSRFESPLTEAPATGVEVINIRDLSEVHRSKKFVYFLGLTNEQLLEQRPTAASFQDVTGLSRDLGVFLPFSESRRLEYRLQHFLEDFVGEAVLAVAQADFIGRPRAASLLWLNSARQVNKAASEVDVPKVTVWSDIKAGHGTRRRDWPADRHARRERSLLEHQGAVTIPPLTWPAGLSLSISNLEEYAKCPFKLAAEKVFRLRDTSEVDVDLDVRDAGSYLHDLLEKLSADLQRDWTEADVAQFLEQRREERGDPIVSALLWSGQKRRLWRIAQRFLDYERAWRSRFPDTETVARELSFETDFGGRPMRGKVDRVDRIRDGYVILDYKSSGSGVTHHGSWLKNDRLQLLFYAEMIRRGGTPLPAGRVAGAFFYVVKEMARDKGFGDADFEELGFELVPQSRIDSEQVADLLAEGVKKVGELMGRIDSGLFHPRPKEVKFCASCAWSEVCRAPHLN